MLVLPLPIHLSIHFLLAVLTGYLFGRYFNRVWLGIIAGVCGGFLIDLDHILEYFLVFGPQFNLFYFLDGRQFLFSGKIHLFFHAWEYAPIFLLIVYFLRRYRTMQVFLLTLTFAALVHISSDCVINNYPPRNYSLLYRYQQRFSAKKLLNFAQYQEYIKNREYLGWPAE